VCVLLKLPSASGLLTFFSSSQRAGRTQSTWVRCFAAQFFLLFRKYRGGRQEDCPAPIPFCYSTCLSTRRADPSLDPQSGNSSPLEPECHASSGQNGGSARKANACLIRMRCDLPQGSDRAFSVIRLPCIRLYPPSISKLFYVEFFIALCAHAPSSSISLAHSAPSFPFCSLTVSCLHMRQLPTEHYTSCSPTRCTVIFAFNMKTMFDP
jgi:hypothetical protein